MFRDIRTCTICMDKKVLPRLNDFHSAIIYDPARINTSDVGDAIYRPPESLITRRYNLSADVYSFGMLLYELCEERPIFSNSHLTDVVEAISENPDTRPSFSKTPFNMRSLIKKCWATKPDGRPTFAKLFKKFSKGKYFFEGTIASKVKSYAKMLLEDDEKRAAEGKKKPEIRINIDRIIVNLEKEANPNFLNSSLSKNFLARMEIQKVKARAQEQSVEKKDAEEEPKKAETVYKPIPKITHSAATRSVRAAKIQSTISHALGPLKDYT